MNYYKPELADFELWEVIDTETPTDCAMRFVRDGDDGTAWDLRSDLINEGKIFISLDELEKTTDPLPEDEQFDGYEPGQEYYRKTGKTITVSLRIAAEVVNG